MPFENTWLTISIMLLAATITFLTSLANRLLTDPEKSKAWRKEIMEWNAQLRKAQKSGDKKQIEKLMKKQQYILQLNSKMTWQSLKVTFIFFIPLLLVWQFLGRMYWNVDIAFFPGVGPKIQVPLIGEVASLYWWYLLCSLLFGLVFSHMFGLTSVE
ncbi:MAG: EMC3/TMCO1 family protein [Candidatus Bathyarchaeia archaeon]